MICSLNVIDENDKKSLELNICQLQGTLNTSPHQSTNHEL